MARLPSMLLVIAAVSLLAGLGAFGWANTTADEIRTGLVKRSASGRIVLLAIDNRSLSAIGVWPWPREVHAEIADRLMDLGAAEVFFDVDFSAASDAASDAAFATALEASGGAVMLAAFRQHAGISAEAAQVGENIPLAMFREHAWLASVNIFAEADGRIRSYPFGQVIGVTEVPSVAAMLSGRFGQPGTSFAIDFSIDPASIPAVSVIDLLEGQVPQELIEGRSIVVGAHAVELRDNFSIPVHGVLPGSLLQILAAETLIQGTAPQPIRWEPLMLLAGVLVIGIGVSPLGRRLASVQVCYAAAAALIEAAAIWLQIRHALVLPTPVLHATVAASGLVLATRELDLRHWLLVLARVEKRNSDNVLERVIADSSDAVFVVDDGCAILRASERAYDLFDAIRPGGQARLEGVVPAELAAAVRASIEAMRAGRAEELVKGELTFQAAGGERHLAYTITPSRLSRIRRGSRDPEEVFVACLTAQDVTLAVQQQRRLDHLARFDVLTGAMNRLEFLRDMAAGCATPAVGVGHAVFALNLHRFKTINGTLGRETGDALLRAVAERLASADRRLSPPARISGDTFALHSTGPVSTDEAEKIAVALAHLVSSPFELGEVSARVGARVGIAFASGSDPASVVLDSAEHALDEARREPGGAVRVFDGDAYRRQDRAREIERALWSALQRQEMHLVYQPQVAIADGAHVGAEALVRWTHPTLGPVSPVEFIEIAESCGFIEHLGRWVLEQACRDATEWADELTVAVNVSPLQFQRSDVMADVVHALAVSGLPANRLHLEITESVLMADSPELLEILGDLRVMGVSLALDDFGSGFSSFGYLAKLPLDKLKLDRMFVQYLDSDPANEAVVKSVALLSRELGLTLLCEGVETAEQERFLRSLGCDQAQGYFYAKPQSRQDVAVLFQRPLISQGEPRSSGVRVSHA